MLNPGSVGLPRDGDPRAAFAIIEDNKIELKRVDYPIEETVARVEQMPWPRRAKEITASVAPPRPPLDRRLNDLVPDFEDEPSTDE